MLFKLFLSLLSFVAYYRSRGLTLADGMSEIYKEYGITTLKRLSLLPFSGVDGAEQIKEIMAVP